MTVLAVPLRLLLFVVSSLSSSSLLVGACMMMYVVEVVHVVRACMHVRARKLACNKVRVLFTGCYIGTTQSHLLIFTGVRSTNKMYVMSFITPSFVHAWVSWCHGGWLECSLLVVACCPGYLHVGSVVHGPWALGGWLIGSLVGWLVGEVRAVGWLVESSRRRT